MQKIFMSACVALAAVFGVAGCDVAGVTESEFVVQISGTPGLPFSGNYLVMKSGGANAQTSVEGRVPVEYRLMGSMVSASFQKQAVPGELRVVVTKGGKVAGQASTTAAYGVAAVAAQ